MAVISDMSQPLGYAVGNTLEVREAIDTLKGEGPEDLRELCLVLGSYMVYLAGMVDNPNQARKNLEKSLASGHALQIFKDFLAAQGGDTSVVDNPTRLPQAKYQIVVTAPQTGVVAAIKAEEIGVAAMLLGAGRATKESIIDLAVGVVLHKKIGDNVATGEPLATIHSNQQRVDAVLGRIQQAYTITAQSVEKPPLIYDIIEG
jgi:pyrimidine-nucleoside phosphorylase